MPRLRTLILTDTQRHDLERLRATAPKPALRERAAALLKIAAGQRPAHVAADGLLRPHKADTIYRWLTRYQQEGLAGLADRPGRGRKPVFSPSARGRRPNAPPRYGAS